LNVFVKNIPDHWDDARLMEIFTGFGEILSLKVAVDENGQSKCHGFVSFKEHDQAEAACEVLNGKEFDGKKYECVKWIDTILEENETYEGDLLKQVELMEKMNDLDLENSDDYINCMKPVLDPDSLGIILYDAFLDNFCDGQEEVENTCFNCFHYNGRIDSNIDQKVVFNLGRAQVVDFQDNGMAVNEISQILATRWKGVQIDWDNLVVPSVI